MALDVSTTHYAISNNLGYEGNSAMLGIVSNPILFIGIKLIGSLVIIFMMQKCLERNKKVSFIGMRLIIFMMLFVVTNNFMVISANATDNSYFEPICITPSYNSDYVFQLTSNNASTGNMFEVGINGIGYFSPANNRMSNGSDILCTVQSRTVTTNNIVRVFGASENGKVWYFDNNLVDYSLGFYTLGPLDLSCSGSGGNCNPVYEIANLSVTTRNRRIIEDTSGNIYVNDGLTIYILQRSSGYAPTVFRTLVAGTDYTASKSSDEIIDMQIDSSGNIHALVGGYMYCTAGQCSAFLSKTTMDSSGNFVFADKSIISHTTSGILYATMRTGALVIDSTNGTHNYSIAYVYEYGATIDDIGTVTLQHHTASGLTTISATTLNSISDMEYFNGQLYLASWNEDIIRNYATTFVGQTLSSEFAGTPEITYTTKTIEPLQLTYYNQSNIKINYNIAIDNIDLNNLALDLSDYRWMISMTDPNGVSKDVYQTSDCSFPALSFTCSVSETLEFAWPSPGWLPGDWTAKLYEINTVIPNRALLATSSTFTVLNTTVENQSSILNPTIPITSGTAPQAISLIDGFVSWLGLGVNSVSKFLFAGIIIAICGAIGFLIRGGNGNIAMVFAFLPYAFFTMIDYIPKWIFIITIILLAIVSRAFR